MIFRGEGRDHGSEVRLGIQVYEKDLLPHAGPGEADGHRGCRLPDTSLVVCKADCVSHCL